MKLSKLLIIPFIIAGLTSQAQIKEVGALMGAGEENAKILFENYLAPMTNAWGAALSGGWYNTAKSHKLGGFDLTLTVNTGLIPATAKTFDMAPLGLTGVTYPNGSEIPTIAGEKGGGVILDYQPSENLPGVVFHPKTPGGTGLGFMPTPMLQLSVGLIKKTDLTVRYMPTVNFGEYGSMGMWGVGAKHSIKQWIPVISKVPVLQLALQGGYTSFLTSANISITPDSYGISNYTGDYSDQSLDLEINSFTTNILVGANLPIICFYGGIGIATTRANLDLKGNIPVPIVTVGGEKDVMDIDGFSLEMKNSDGSLIKPRLNAGFRLKFGVLTIHGDYTYANYSVATAGIGISFR